MLKIDDDIGNNECLLSFFKNVHPNTITISGIISNFIILKLINNKQIPFANLVLIFRFFTDILDGAVARKYKKSSKIGGLLDTISDCILIVIYSYIISNRFLSNKTLVYIIMVGIFLLYFYYFIKNDSLTNHDNIKKKKDNFFSNVIVFLINNTIVSFIFLILFNNKFMKK